MAFTLLGDLFRPVGQHFDVVAVSVIILLFFFASTAFDSLPVADAEEELSLPLPGPIVQRRAGN